MGSAAERLGYYFPKRVPTLDAFVNGAILARSPKIFVTPTRWQGSYWVDNVGNFSSTTNLGVEALAPREGRRELQFRQRYAALYATGMAWGDYAETPHDIRDAMRSRIVLTTIETAKWLRKELSPLVEVLLGSPTTSSISLTDPLIEEYYQQLQSDRIRAYDTALKRLER